MKITYRINIKYRDWYWENWQTTTEINLEDLENWREILELLYENLDGHWLWCSKEYCWYCDCDWIIENIEILDRFIDNNK